jgi:translation initiation factor 2 gamma subunit (eIF-2gamma)
VFKALSGHWRDTHQREERRTLAQALGMETPFQCQECPLAYANKYGISQHVRIGAHV